MIERKGILSTSVNGETVYSDVEVLDGKFNIKLSDNHKEDRDKFLSKFGFFGSEADRTGYDPTIKTAEDVVPKEEQYYKQPFRLLSATVVGGGTWKATDFSDEKVLRKSTSMLEGVPLYIDHNLGSVYNMAGVVKDARYTKAYTDINGNNIPSGIEAVTWTDATTHPEIVRKLAAKTLNAGSVTVVFNWTPSHEFESDYMFEDQIGRMVDGRMVTRVVTSIEKYYEYSLVLDGADPFAKQINEDGQLNKPSMERAFKQGFSNNNNKIITNINKPNKMEKELNLLLAKLGVEKAEFTEEWVTNFKIHKDNPESLELEQLSKDIKGLFSEEVSLSDALPKIKVGLQSDFEKLENDFSTASGKVESLTSDLAESKAKVEESVKELVGLKESNVNLETKVTELSSTIESNKVKVELGTKVGEQKKAEVVRLYSLSVGNKPAQAMLDVFDKSSDVELDAFLESYGGKLTSEYSATCKDCGSTNVSMQSSFRKVEVNKEGNKSNFTSVEDIRKERLSAQSKKSYIK